MRSIARWSLGLAALIAVAACTGGSDGARPAEDTSQSGRPVVTTTTGEPAPRSTSPDPSTSDPTTSSPTEPRDESTPPPGLAVEEVAAGFRDPVLAVAPPGDDRLFVVEQPGRIMVLAGADASTFLDLAELVESGGNEQGLLGLAFHPEYPSNGRFYVDYTGAGGVTVIEEYRVSDDPDRADPDSGRVILRVPQPASNHNGGMVVFGPDGYLYVALGDGGAAGDAFGHGQRPDTLLGTILRIDVDREGDAGTPYAIPPDNPFVDGAGGAPEVWAYGLRNPWRFSIDQVAGLISIGDVGQNAYEEVNLAPVDQGGINYGWPIREGAHCFPADADCSTDGLTDPVVTIDRSVDRACSVIGGYVYRGSDIPELQGHHLFGDFCGGWMRSFPVDDPGAITDWDVGRSLEGLTSFGLDGDGEVLLIERSGRVLRLVPAG